jgi:hypothetical protein
MFIYIYIYLIIRITLNVHIDVVKDGEALVPVSQYSKLKCTILKEQKNVSVRDYVNEDLNKIKLNMCSSVGFVYPDR